MNDIAERIRRATAETSVLAMSLDELLYILDHDGCPECDVGQVVDTVLRCPKRYRILNPMRGAWTTAELSKNPGEYRQLLEEQFLTGELWVVSIGNQDRDTSGDPLARWTCRSLACIAGSLDERSPAAVNRWFRLLREHRLLRRKSRTLGMDAWGVGGAADAATASVPARQG